MTSENAIVLPENQELCYICKQMLINKCHTNSCLHLFCFECLIERSLCDVERQSCPLCLKTFQYIFHSFTDTSHDIFDIYEASAQDLSEGFEKEFMHNLWMEPGEDINYQFRPIYGQRNRINVYATNIWADPLSDTNGQFRGFSISYFRNHRQQMLPSLRTFIYRDVIAIRSFLVPAHRFEEFQADMISDILTHFILDLICFCEINKMINILQVYLTVHCEHFCHELYNFANSPFSMITYDQLVKYRIHEE